VVLQTASPATAGRPRPGTRRRTRPSRSTVRSCPRHLSRHLTQSGLCHLTRGCVVPTLSD
jgi:hypothetical protein